MDAWLYDPIADQLVVAGFSTTALAREEVARGITRVPAGGAQRISEVFRTGTPFTTGRADEDPRVHRPLVEELGVRSMLCAPLEWHGRRRGVLLVSWTRQDAYGAGDLEFLETVAQWVVTDTLASYPPVIHASEG